MSDERPTVYLSNWVSHRTPGHHGPGRKLSIMAFTPAWAPSVGRVPDLTPDRADLLAVRAKRITVDEYRQRFEAGLCHDGIAPHALLMAGEDADDCEGIGANPARRIRNGDTLCCTCARAEAAAGRCHRGWAAAALVRAGWRVILDGQEVTP